jgi:putative phage-type endonuclease
MATIVKLVQGSPEWHAHRKRYRNASETPAVLGFSPWVTPYQLWLQKTGKVQPTVNVAMAHGSSSEPLAREAYEKLTGIPVERLVMVSGEYSASLDGITLDGDLLVEIKCPYKGKASVLWQDAEGGRVPVHYYWQQQHQLLVTGAALAHLYVFDGSEGLLVEQRPEPDLWTSIHQGWDEFQKFVETDRPPALTERDSVERTDAEWQAAAARYLEAKALVDQASVDLDAAKQALVALTAHPSEKGAGVAVTRYWKAGAIDYKAIPAIANVDLDAYRKQGREEVRVTAA